MVNPSTAQARVVVDELIRGGVRDVVLCPGSRNAPLAFALHDADRPGGSGCTSASTSAPPATWRSAWPWPAGAPVRVAMTSGTAVANLGPAVVEANYARVPLIVLSANRPYELLGTGANQTMEQLGLLRHAGARRRSASASRRTRREQWPSRTRSWRSAICRVLAAATGSRTANAGPVQFDIPLREPLVPDAEPDLGAGRSRRAAGRQAVDVHAAGHVRPAAGHRPAPDTVVITGHGAGAHPNLAALPTVAEPTAPPAENPLHPLALPLLRPQQVIMLGARRCTARCRRCWPTRRCRCSR